MGREQRLAITIGTSFGLVFVLVNAGALPSPWPLVLRAAAVLALVGVGLALRAAAGRPAADRPGSGFTRGYWLVVAVEVVALFGGRAVVVRVLDPPEAGIAWVSLVAGVHFFGLAVVWRQTSLHVLGAALTVCGAAGLVLAATGADAAVLATVGGIVPGFVLIACGGAAAATSGRVPARA